MVDLHSHVLYGVDDGSKTMEMSMEMIEQSIREGVTHLALTPHHIKDVVTTAMDNKEEYIRKFKQLEKIYQGRIQLIPSLEIMFYENMLEDLENGTLMGYGAKKTVLVEYNLLDFPLASEAVFYEMKKAGYQVILAHPERNHALQEDVEILYHLHDLGVLFQLNAGSLKGQFGSTVKNFALRLVEKNLIHAIGSDGHSPSQRNMKIKYAYDKIKELNPPLYENIMENAKNLIQGESVQVLAYKPWIIEKPRRGIFKYFKKKRVYD